MGEREAEGIDEGAAVPPALLHRLRELRSPLASMRHAARMLCLPGVSEDQLRWSQEVLERQVDQISRVLDELLGDARPVADADAPAPWDPDAPVPPLQEHRLRVLVADDNRDNADTCATLLRMSGHEICTAYSGLEAVAVADVFRPEVALLDIGMPGANGYEVAKRIRSRSWGANAVLVAVTGRSHEDDRRLAQEAGFDHYLVKPVDLQELERLLKARV